MFGSSFIYYDSVLVCIAPCFYGVLESSWVILVKNSLVKNSFLILGSTGIFLARYNFLKEKAEKHRLEFKWDTQKHHFNSGVGFVA